MNSAMLGWLAASSLFGGMLVMLEVGRRFGARAFAADSEAKSGTGPIEGAVFALLGLLVAFTFSGALGRFEERRTWILDEANAVGTAWLRVDLVPEAQREPLRTALRAYVDARLEGYAQRAADPDAEGEFTKAERAGADLWKAAMVAVQPPAMPAAGTLLLPALNEAFDIAAARTLATRRHPPRIVYVMLYLLALSAALFAGYGMGVCKRRRWLHTVGFSFVICGTVGVTMDIEYPRQGLIRVDAFDRTLASVRAGWK